MARSEEIEEKLKGRELSPLSPGGRLDAANYCGFITEQLIRSRGKVGAFPNRNLQAVTRISRGASTGEVERIFANNQKLFDAKVTTAILTSIFSVTAEKYAPRDRSTARDRQMSRLSHEYCGSRVLRERSARRIYIIPFLTKSSVVTSQAANYENRSCRTSETSSQSKFEI